MQSFTVTSQLVLVKSGHRKGTEGAGEWLRCSVLTESAFGAVHGPDWSEKALWDRQRQTLHPHPPTAHRGEGRRGGAVQRRCSSVQDNKRQQTHSLLLSTHKTQLWERGGGQRYFLQLLRDMRHEDRLVSETAPAEFNKASAQVWFHISARLSPVS